MLILNYFKLFKSVDDQLWAPKGPLNKLIGWLFPEQSIENILNTKDNGFPPNVKGKIVKFAWTIACTFYHW